MDKEGKEVEASDSFGMKVGTPFTHPHCCLVTDKTGGDTNMINDSAVGGTKFENKLGLYTVKKSGDRANP